MVLTHVLGAVTGSDEEKAKAWKSLARLAEDAELYDHMCEIMTHLVKHKNGVLDRQERNLLSIAFKNNIGTGRNAHRTLGDESEDGKQPLAAAYRDIVSQEVEAQCKDIIQLLTSVLVPAAENNSDGEVYVFYTKMTADYYRYACEITTSESNKEEYKNKAGEFYQKAWAKATHEEDGLAPYHPIRLGLALNYSVAHYEVLKNKDEACKLAKEAFDKAINNISDLQENDYKDSTLIMQLLRDNLTLWTTEQDAEDA